MLSLRTEIQDFSKKKGKLDFVVLPRKHPNQKSPGLSAHLYVDVSPARTKQRPYLSIRPYWLEIRTVKFLYTNCKETLHFYKSENCILLIHIILRFWHKDCLFTSLFDIFYLIKLK